MSEHTKDNPAQITMLENYCLNKEGSSKDTRHFSFDLEDTGVTYLPGDSLSVYPENDPSLVEELFSLISLDGDENFERNRFLREVNLTRPSNKLFVLLLEKQKEGFSPDISSAQELHNQFNGHSVVSVLKAFPQIKLGSNELAENSSMLRARAYSIASSLNAHPNKVELCVARVDEEINGQKVLGVCSNYLSSRVELNDRSVRAYIHPNERFRLPADSSKDIIMIGPGTGIAPFRAFLEERVYLKSQGASVGRSWLFFGDQKSAYDFIYSDELEAYESEGNLKLTKAFSRDQEHKIYVQTKMRELSDEVFEWLEAGAYFYVCGDARRMAKDVDTVLREIVAEHGKDPDEYIAKLKAESRYSRDVY